VSAHHFIERQGLDGLRPEGVMCKPMPQIAGRIVTKGGGSSATQGRLNVFSLTVHAESEEWNQAKEKLGPSDFDEASYPNLHHRDTRAPGKRLLHMYYRRRA
jgi:hypothetical protein